MSRVVKANNLIYIHNNDEAEENQGVEKTEENLFTSEKAEKLYEETKVMVEELIANARLKGEKIIAEANNEAEEILQNAYREKESMKTQAMEEGLAEGREKGLNEVAAKITEANEIIKKAHQERKNIINNLEDEIINFAITLAEKIVRTEIDKNSAVIKNIAKDLLDMMQDAEVVTLKMNPDDYNYLQDFYSELQARLSQGTLKLEQDTTLCKGDCIVISEGGLIVAKIDQEINKLQEILQEVKHHD